MKSFPIGLLAIASVALVSATTIIPVSIERLTQESSSVVEGTAVQSWSQWNPQHTLIFTYTRFDVSRTLKGSAGSNVVVKQIGGSAGGYTQRVSGVRHWRPGEQAVLFLQPSKAGDGISEVTGLMQGNFVMQKSTTGVVTVTNGVPGVSSLQPASGQLSRYQGSKLRLQDLESRVRKAVQQ